MTNEQILKLFEFELNMGIFKPKKLKYSGITLIPFKSMDNRKLVKVLNALGYKGGQPVYIQSPIEINLELRTYSIIDYRMFYKEGNSIPSYIYLYNDGEYL